MFEKCFQKFLILPSNLKSENILAVLKHLYIGLLRELEKAISLTLVRDMSLLINKCFIAIGNTVFKQDIVVTMNIDSAPFWSILYFFNQSI